VTHKGRKIITIYIFEAGNFVLFHIYYLLTARHFWQFGIRIINLLILLTTDHQPNFYYIFCCCLLVSVAVLYLFLLLNVCISINQTLSWILRFLT
jgi:hypothetical protein